MAEEMIYKAIPAIMADMDAIGKTKRNQQQNFMYRGVDDVMNALSPALVKHNVFITPEVLEQAREERKTVKGGTLIYSICKMRYKFFAEDGSFIEAVTVGEGMDSGDKATNKAMAAAFKYACFQVFCIPTEEMKDPDAKCHQVAPKAPEQNTVPKTQYRQGMRETPEEAQKNAELTAQAKSELIDGSKINAIREAIRQKGLSELSVLKNYKISSFDEMDTGQWMNAMDILQKYQDAPK